MTAVFDRNDKDGDGKLSKGEFKEMMMREKGKEVAKEKNKDNKEKKTWEQKIGQICLMSCQKLDANTWKWPSIIIVFWNQMSQANV